MGFWGEGVDSMTAAVISVSNKEGICQFASSLAQMGFAIYSTGGTQRTLLAGGVSVSTISDLTGFPEILDGRVKTLHPRLYGGILARRDVPGHMEELAENELMRIDLVCVNLYPFVETVARADVSLADALENIDIGGPSLVRAAAKNFLHVLVVVDPEDYGLVLDRLSGHGGLAAFPLDLRRSLAAKAFQHVSSYDTAIAQYLRREELMPDRMTLALSRQNVLRYGENPHQRGAIYREERAGETDGYGIVAAKHLQGKALSYNNVLDADAAWGAVSTFAAPTVAIVKHNNPCGLASRDDLTEAYREALAGDPISAFGGVIAINRPLIGALAEEIADTFYEVVVAPSYDDGAMAILGKRSGLRLIEMGGAAKAVRLDYRRVSGGLLVQEADEYPDEEIKMRQVSERAPTAVEEADLLFAWKVAKHVKSNAIVIARDAALLGMGAGQPNRAVSVHLALRLADLRPDGQGAKGSVLASDAFFPFPDGVEMAATGGVTAIIQPGGSIRDKEVIRAADKHGMAMVCTGVRHFKH